MDSSLASTMASSWAMTMVPNLASKMVWGLAYNSREQELLTSVIVYSAYVSHVNLQEIGKTQPMTTMGNPHLLHHPPK
eukprot:2831963-Ditylum_brightwellii.AAC.1